MAQCQADHKKHSTSRFDLYGDIFSGQLYGPTGGNGVGGHMDRMHSCPSFRLSGENFMGRENLSIGSFREDPRSVKAAVLKTAESPTNGYGYGYGVNSGAGLGLQQQYSSVGTGIDRRRSTGGIMKAPLLSSETSPVAPPPTKSGANRSSNPPIPKESSPAPTASGTPPPFQSHSRKSSGEFPKGIHPDGFAYGEIIKGVGNLCDDLFFSTGGLKSGDLETGSSGGGSSTKGRSQRAESPKSIGSSSSGGSSSGGSPTVQGRVFNFGNILPSGGSVKSNGTLPGSNSSASVSGRGVAAQTNGGHAPVPVPTSGALRGSRRSNSWDYATGTHKASHARSGSESGNGGAYTGANVGISPKGSLSTSPSGSLGSSSAYGSPLSGNGNDRFNKAGVVVRGCGNGAPISESEHILIRKALNSMDAEEVKNAGNDLYKKGHFSDALSLYDKALFLAPDKVPFRSNRAAALTGLGRLCEAVQECHLAIRLDSSYSRAHHRLATLYLRLGLVDKAARHFRSSGSQVEWSDTQRSLAIEKHLRKCNEARKALDWQALIRETDATIIAGADSSPQVMAFKAEAQLKLHRPEEADSVMMNVRKFDDLLKRKSLASINGMVLLVQAEIDMALGRFDNAVLAAEKASQNAPNDFAVTLLLRRAQSVAKARKLGNDLFKAGKFSEAVIAYGEGLEGAPKNAVLLCNRAACRSKLNQWEKAVEDSNAALEAQPNYTKALLRRAQSYAKLERWEDACRDYEVLRREVPGDAEVARALFDTQVALKRSKGEDTYKIRRFGGDVVEVTTNEQFQEAITAPGLAVVQFSTRWSERCRELTPFIEDLSKRYLSIAFVKVDVDDHPYLAKLENVDFVPTFKIYKNGSKVKEIAGPTEQALERALNPFSA